MAERFLSPARRRRLAHTAVARVTLPPGGFDVERHAAVAPQVRLTGWAWPFGDERIERVEVLADGAPAGAARLVLRPDIAEALDRPEAMLCGFDAGVALPRTARMLTARVHGSAGSVAETPAHPVVVAEAAEPAAPVPAAAGAAVAAPAEAPGPEVVALPPAASPLVRPAAPLGLGASAPAAADADRERLRRRFGFDPWHVVVLVPDAEGGGGPAVAALDVLAERRPGLELVVPTAHGDHVLLDLLRRAVVACGLEDRVTLPAAEAPGVPWPVLADAALAPGGQDDLAALIAALDRACDGVAPRAATARAGAAR